MSNTGGKEIQDECTKYIKGRSSLMKPGDVYVSTAGRLPCRKVIHTVGPKYKDGESQTTLDLDTYFKIYVCLSI